MVAPGRDIPEELGNYRVISALGSGGMGTAYLVESKLLGRRSVMKVGGADLDERARERFRSEAVALRQLEHPNIPALLEVGMLPDGRPFLVTEWIEGSDLATLLASRPQLPVRDALLLARAVANALGCAHGHGILHLDVKPENILVPHSGGQSRFEEAKLLDFGVLGKLQPDTHTTLSGSLIGTPYYMSPEQVRAEALTPAADIFSLGVVAYQMLSGRRPFEGASPMEMFAALLSKEPAPLGPPTPPLVADLVRRCLDKDPGNRPRSGVEMAALMDGLLNSTGEFTQLFWQSRVPEPPPSPAMMPSVLGPGEYTRMFSQPVVADVPVAAAAPQSPSIIATVAIVLVGFFGVIGVVFVVLVMFARQKASTAMSYPPPPVSPGSDEPWLLLAGVLLMVGGVMMGIAVRRYLVRKREQITGDISKLLTGGRTRKALSMTLAIQVDEVIAKCRLMDEKFLGLTMAVMVKEYDSARKFDDRQKALMNAIAILDKLGPKLSPWYVRHEKMVATAVSMVGIVSGLATAATSVAKLVRGTP
jgi:serine/threonine protein kinase